LSSFVGSFLTARGITYLLRHRSRFGPFRNMRVGRRHIHHFVPGIVVAFASGAAAIVTRDEDLEPLLAVPFGIGMGLTLDESALLLELEDVYWSREGLLRPASAPAGPAGAPASPSGPARVRPTRSGKGARLRRPGPAGRLAAADRQARERLGGQAARELGQPARRLPDRRPDRAHSCRDPGDRDLRGDG
jgi:hypothetical protein